MTTRISDEQRFEAYVNMVEQKTKRPLTDEELNKIRFISEIEEDSEFAHIFEATTDLRLDNEQ